MADTKKPAQIMASVEAENHLLSCCFFSAETDAWAIHRCFMRKVRPMMFTDPRNLTIYRVMMELHDRNLPVSIQMVAEELKAQQKLEKVGFKHLTECSQLAGSAAQTDYFITRVSTYWKMREVVRQAMELLESVPALVPEPETFNEEVMPRLNNISDLMVDEQDERLEDVVDRVESDFDLVVSGKEIQGENIKFGIEDIDKRLTPLNGKKDKYVCIAARPSVGKTALATQIMQHTLASIKDSVVLDFQLENSRDNHIQQMAARAAQINLEKPDEWKPEAQELFKKYLAGLRRISEKRLFVYEKDLTIEQIKARARWVHRLTGKITLIVVDYLQLVGTDDRNVRGQREVINHVSRELKMLAKEIGCPILVLSQLSREYMKHNRLPNMQDLKESGNIEADADRVWMLHVPEKASIDKETGCIETLLLQRKNKYGRVGRCSLVHKRTTTTFFAKAKSDETEGEEDAA